jgi:hypothetical protein
MFASDRNGEASMLNEAESALQQAIDAVVMEERRRDPRRECGLCVTAVPCDESGNAIGSLIVGHCLDVSDSGIRISTAHQLRARHVRVEPLLPAAVFGFRTAVFEVLRQTSEAGVFTYAGRFIGRKPY